MGLGARRGAGHSDGGHVTSRAYRLFLDEIEAGGEQGTVSYTLNPMEALEGEERQEAEDRLIALARTGDLRAVETLGLAGLTRSLALREHLTEKVFAGDRRLGVEPHTRGGGSLRGAEVQPGLEGAAGPLLQVAGHGRFFV